MCKTTNEDSPTGFLHIYTFTHITLGSCNKTNDISWVLPVTERLRFLAMALPSFGAADGEAEVSAEATTMVKPMVKRVVPGIPVERVYGNPKNRKLQILYSILKYDH